MLLQSASHKRDCAPDDAFLDGIVCPNARKKRNKAWKLLRDSPTAKNLNSFRNVKCRPFWGCQQARKESWQKFLVGIYSHTDEERVWNMVGKVAGRRAHWLSLVNTQDHSLEDQANSLGAHFEQARRTILKRCNDTKLEEKSRKYSTNLRHTRHTMNLSVYLSYRLLLFAAMNLPLALIE